MIVPRIVGVPNVTTAVEHVIAAAVLRCNADPLLVTADLYNFGAPVRNGVGDYTLPYARPPAGTDITVTLGVKGVYNLGNPQALVVAWFDTAADGLGVPGIRVVVKLLGGGAVEAGVQISVLVNRIPATVGGQ